MRHLLTILFGVLLCFQLDAQTEDSLYINARLAYDTGKFTECVSLCNQGFQAHNANIVYYYHLRGRAYFKLDQHNQCLKDFGQAIQLNDTMSSVYNDRGMVYLLLLDYKLAKKDFEKAVNLDERNAEYYFNLAYVCTKMIKMDNAIFYYNKSLELRPTNYDALVNRAYVHCVQQHFK